MSIEVVLQNEVLTNLRNKNIISVNEVAISVGDLFYAKDVLTNEKRVLDKSILELANEDQRVPNPNPLAKTNLVPYQKALIEVQSNGAI